MELAAERVPNVVRTLTQEGWRVEADGKLYRRAGAVRMEIRSGVDWFDLDGGAEFGAAGGVVAEVAAGDQTRRAHGALG